MQTHINIFGEDANGVHINKINDDYLARYSEKVIQKHRDAMPTDHADGSIGTQALADGAVTTTKIADGAITEDKLSLDVTRIIEKSGWAVTTITLTDDVYSLSNGAGAQGQIIVVQNSTGKAVQYVSLENYSMTFDRYISIGEIVVCRCISMSHDGARYETIMTLYVDEKVASNDILDGAVGMSKLDEEVIEKLNELDTNDKILKTSITKKTNTVEIYGTDNLSHIVKSTFIDGDCTVDTNGNGVLNIYIDVSDSSGITLDDVIIPIENATLTLNMSEALSPYEGYVTCVFDVLTHEIRWRIDNEQAEKGLYDTQLIFSPFSFEYDYNGENLLSAGVDIHNITKEYQYKKSLTDLQTKNKDSILDAINELASKNSKTIYVQCDGDHDELKLQNALTNASSGDIVYPVGDCIITNENTVTTDSYVSILNIAENVTVDGRYCGLMKFKNTTPANKQIIFNLGTEAKLKNIYFTEEDCTIETINPTLVYAGKGVEVSDCYFTEIYDNNQIDVSMYGIYLNNYCKFLRNRIDGYYVNTLGTNCYLFRALADCNISDNVFENITAETNITGRVLSAISCNVNNNVFSNINTKKGFFELKSIIFRGNRIDNCSIRMEFSGIVNGCRFVNTSNVDGCSLIELSNRSNMGDCTFHNCTMLGEGSFIYATTYSSFVNNVITSLTVPDTGEIQVLLVDEANVVSNNVITTRATENAELYIVDGYEKTICTGNITSQSSIGRFDDTCVVANNITGA